jgi:F0F1-type ATP synthase membrane subunit b/b'
MPKGAKKNAEEIVKDILAKQKEQVRKIQERDREKIKKLNAALAKERLEKRSEAGAALEKLYKESGSSLDVKKVLVTCEKYWPFAAGTPDKAK